jgi:hypothetical protein
MLEEAEEEEEEARTRGWLPSNATSLQEGEPPLSFVISHLSFVIPSFPPVIPRILLTLSLDGHRAGG